MNTENQQWGSRIGYILATIGMAFGLGAIWRFPYVAAESGGGAFVLIFTVGLKYICYKKQKEKASLCYD